jgi:hypothetical protein
MKDLPKVLPARVPTQRRFVQNYVALLSGILRLTDTELLVLVEIVWDLYSGKSREEVFSPDGRGEVRDRIGKTGKNMSVHNFNNYLMSLKRKEAIFQTDEGYDINPWLYPRNELTFKYKVDEKLTRDI